MLTRARLMEAYGEVYFEMVGIPITPYESKSLYDNYLSHFHNEVTELIYKQMNIFIEDQEGM